ncbi:Oxidized purine nucleoside triphosphate hydrolase [Abortiporus biennis]
MAAECVVPPGVVHDRPLVEVHAGGVDEWVPIKRVKMFTNAFIVQDGKILLGYKKRGIGQGLFNGFGGKVEAGETPAEAAVRELREEAGIDAPLRQIGMLSFKVEDVEEAFHIDIFMAEEHTGTIIETEEMRPQWFSTTTQTDGDILPPIPYENMWADDIFWLPLLLSKQKFAGRADFNTGNKMLKWWFGKETS